MARELACGDIIHGCDAKIRGENDEEVLRKAAEHARQAHGIQEVDPGTADLLKSKIRTT